MESGRDSSPFGRNRLFLSDSLDLWLTAPKLLEIFPKTLRKGHLGLRYLDLLETMQPVRQQLGLADFRSVDEFAYALSQPAKRTGG